MRKNVLSLSIAAMIGGLGFAGAASAAVVIPPASNAATQLLPNVDGIGHILVVPYFSTQEGNGTLLTVVNTDTSNGKAVKVRFRGASNSDDLFDFQLLMSPGDVWTGAVFQDAATGQSYLTTNDTSCTIPARTEINAAKFSTSRLYAGATDVASETREGYVEILNMADIHAGTPLYAAIKHDSNGQNPCNTNESDLDAITALMTDPTSLGDKGLWAPTGGLTGTWTILNQTTGYLGWSGVDVAVAATDNAGNMATGNLVFAPQLSFALTGGDATLFTADPLVANDILAPLQYDVPDLSTPYIPAHIGNPSAQAAELSAAFAVTSVINEWVTEAAIGASTDWVFSLPTRRYAIAYDYTNKRVVYNTANQAYFAANNTTVRTSANGVPQICVTGIGTLIYGREEEGARFSVSPGSSLSFCGETSVVTVKGVGSTGVSSLNSSVATTLLNVDRLQFGWINLGTTGATNVGIPTTGDGFFKYVGNPTAGKSTNYGATLQHRYRRPALPIVSE